MATDHDATDARLPNNKSHVFVFSGKDESVAERVTHQLQIIFAMIGDDAHVASPGDPAFTLRERRTRFNGLRRLCAGSLVELAERVWPPCQAHASE